VVAKWLRWWQGEADCVVRERGAVKAGAQMSLVRERRGSSGERPMSLSLHLDKSLIYKAEEHR
jgi:hypothetical protein